MNMTPSISMDNTGDMSGSLTTSSNDMMYDVKPQNGHGLQQSFSDTQGQGQGWQQDNGNNGNAAQFWPQPPYFTT
jgi:hypothetical protein